MLAPKAEALANLFLTIGLVSGVMPLILILVMVSMLAAALSVRAPTLVKCLADRACRHPREAVEFLSALSCHFVGDQLPEAPTHGMLNSCSFCSSLAAGSRTIPKRLASRSPHTLTQDVGQCMRRAPPVPTHISSAPSTNHSEFCHHSSIRCTTNGRCKLQGWPIEECCEAFHG